MMLSGRRYRDTTAWCGAGEKYEGEFALEVRTGDGGRTRKRLDGFHFFRSGEWRLRFGDHNGDGRAEFNLGQYGSCNGWRYRLYTVERSGQVRRLPLADSGSDWLPVGDRANSTGGIVPVGGGFRHCCYDNRTTHTIRRYR